MIAQTVISTACRASTLYSRGHLPAHSIRALLPFVVHDPLGHFAEVVHTSAGPDSWM